MHFISVRNLSFLLVTVLSFPLLAEASIDAARFKMLHHYALIADSAYQDKTGIEKVLSAQG